MNEPDPTTSEMGAPGADPTAAPDDANVAASETSTSDEVAELKDRYLRLAAEFENYRKRVDRERAEGGNRAQAQLVERLLDGLDDLQRIADFTPETARAEALLEGAQLVERKLFRALEAAGLESIDAAGKPFDPSLHEALATVETDTEEDDHTVSDVFQTGYRFHGTLLRPARVRVKKFGA